MLAQDPAYRLSLTELLQHEWCKEEVVTKEELLNYIKYHIENDKNTLNPHNNFTQKSEINHYNNIKYRCLNLYPNNNFYVNCEENLRYLDISKDN